MFILKRESAKKLPKNRFLFFQVVYGSVDHSVLANFKLYLLNDGSLCSTIINLDSLETMT